MPNTISLKPTDPKTIWNIEKRERFALIEVDSIDPSKHRGTFHLGPLHVKHHSTKQFVENSYVSAPNFASAVGCRAFAQCSHVAVEIYDSYAKLFDPDYEYVCVNDERFILQVANEVWDEVAVSNLIINVIPLADGVEIKKTFDTAFGPATLEISYIVRTGRLLKHKIVFTNKQLETKTFRVIMRLSGITSSKVIASTPQVITKERAVGAIKKFSVGDDPQNLKLTENLEGLGDKLQNVIFDSHIAGSKCDIIIGDYTLNQDQSFLIDPATDTWPVGVSADDGMKQNGRFGNDEVDMKFGSMPRRLPIFKDGFEDGNFSAWTGTETTTGETATVVTTEPHHGTYHARFYDDGNAIGSISHVYKTLGSDYPIIYTRVYMKFLTALPAANEWYEIIHHKNGGNLRSMAMVWNDGGTMKWRVHWWRPEWGYATSTTPAINLDQWYCVELKTIIHETNGGHSLFVDGVEVISVTGLDTTGTDPNINRIEVGSCYSTGATEHTIYVDCVVVDSSYIGPEPIFEDGFESGDFSAWTSTSENGTTVAVQSSVVHRGGYAASISGLDNADEYGIIKKTLAQVATMHARIYIRFTQAFNLETRVGVFDLRKLGGAMGLHLERLVAGTYRWRYVCYNPDFSLYSETFALELDTWYCLEIKGVISETVGEMAVWVDGVTVIDETGLDTGTVLFNGVWAKAYQDVGNANAGTIYFDDAIADSSYIGPETMQPGDIFARFPSVTIPNGVTISEASLSFKGHFAQAGTVVLSNIYQENADNPAAVSSSVDWDGRSKTSAIAWDSIPAWSADERGSDTQTPELKTHIQTVVNRVGWGSGQAMQFFIHDDGSDDDAYRSACTYDCGVHSDQLAKLTVIWAVPVEKTFSADAFLQKPATKTFLGDGLLQKEAVKTFIADAVLSAVAEHTKTFAGDGRLLRIATKTLVADALIQASPTKSLTGDGVLITSLTKDFLGDALLEKPSTKEFLGDAFLLGAQTKTLEADGVIQGEFTKTLTGDALFVVQQTKTLTGDSILKGSLTKTLKADAILIIESGVRFILADLETHLKTIGEFGDRVYRHALPDSIAAFPFCMINLLHDDITPAAHLQWHNLHILITVFEGTETGKSIDDLIAITGKLVDKLDIIKHNGSLWKTCVVNGDILYGSTELTKKHFYVSVTPIIIKQKW